MVNIRQIKKDEADHVKELINDIMGGELAATAGAYVYNDLDNLSEHYGGDRDIFLVAEKDGKIVGTVAIKEDGEDVALLRRVFVHADYRGQGYGAKLLCKAMDFCFKHKYKTVTFRGTDKMQTALRLCMKSGFEEEDVSELGDFKLVILSKEL
jgi:N-acetylglutamate synthase-like GNAT family acetyltransferase